MNAYVAYMRPRTFGPTFVFPLTGYALSPGRPTEPLWVARDLGLMFLVYSVLLWGGTNAYNSSHDRDVGPVNLLPDPPPIPPHLASFGLTAEALACVLSFALFGIRAAALACVAAMLSVLYSRRRSGPNRRGKDIPGVDIAINALGCGLGSVLFGFVVSGEPLTPFVAVVGLAFSVAIFGGVPTSQIFQRPEAGGGDHDENYTSRLGPARTLRVGAMLLVVHAVVLSMATTEAEWSWSGATRTLVGTWLLLVMAGAIHSWRWSRTPLVAPYRKMLRQMSLMMTSQLAWTVAAFSATTVGVD